MSFQPVFAEFWEKVKESIENKTYAKLTLAKTIGDTELKNDEFGLKLGMAF
mgnify:CR=1 FL=1